AGTSGPGPATAPSVMSFLPSALPGAKSSRTVAGRPQRPARPGSLVLEADGLHVLLAVLRVGREQGQARVVLAAGLAFEGGDPHAVLFLHLELAEILVRIVVAVRTFPDHLLLVAVGHALQALAVARTETDVHVLVALDDVVAGDVDLQVLLLDRDAAVEALVGLVARQLRILHGLDAVLGVGFAAALVFGGGGVRAEGEQG